MRIRLTELLDASKASTARQGGVSQLQDKGAITAAFERIIQASEPYECISLWQKAGLSLIACLLTTFGPHALLLSIQDHGREGDVAQLL